MGENGTIITDQPIVNITIPTDSPGVTTSQNVEPQPQASQETKTDAVTQIVDNSHTHQWSKHQTEDKVVCTQCGEQVDIIHNGGRHCKYCDNALAIQKKADEYVRSIKTTKGGIPFIEELADVLDVDSDTIDNWASKKKSDESLEHPLFFGTIKKVKNYQKLQLLKRTLGRFNPSGAIFQLKANHGLMESEKRVIAGDKDEPLVITVVEEDRHVATD